MKIKMLEMGIVMVLALTILAGCAGSATIDGKTMGQSLVGDGQTMVTRGQ